MICTWQAFNMKHMVSWSWNGTQYLAQGHYNRTDYYWHKGWHHTPFGWRVVSPLTTTLPAWMPSTEKDLRKTYVHACMWVSCACVQKFNCSKVLPSLIFFMCVPRVPATFLQIFIPGVKRSWSLSPVYSPVLSLSRLSRWPFFILTESDRGEGTKSQGAGKRASERGVRSGEERGSKEKAFGEERERHIVKEKWAGGAVHRDGWLVIL